MARIERLHHVVGLGAAHLADHETVWAKSQRGVQQLSHRYRFHPVGCGRPRLEAYHVRREQVQFCGVLDGDHPFVVRHGTGEGVQEGGLAGGGCPAHDDVAAARNEVVQ